MKKLVVLLCLALSSILYSQDSFNIEFLFKTINGSSNDAITIGNYCYSNAGDDFIIVDLTDRTSPELINAFNVGSEIRDLYVVDTIAYIVNNTPELMIFDIENPFDIELISRTTIETYSIYLYVRDNLAFISTSNADFRIYDISEPVSPVLLSTYPIQRRCLSFDIVDNLVYMACSDSGLKILDIENPEYPILMSNYGSIGTALDIEISDNIAYIASFDTGLCLFDISAPESPTLLGIEFTEQRPCGIFLDSTIAIVTDTRSHGFVMDFSSADSISILDTISLNGRSKSFIADDFAYFSSDRGIKIVDISTPSSTVSIGDLTTRLQVVDMCSNDPCIYAADYSFGIVYDYSNKLNKYNILLDDVTPGYNVNIESNNLFLTPYRNGFISLDISSPLSPELIASYEDDSISYQFDTQIVNDYAYIASCLDGIQIIDISDLHFPTLSHVIETDGDVRCLYIEENTLYVGDSGSGMKIYDISDPISPVLLGEYFTDGLIQSLIITNNHAYLGDVHGLEIVNISNPAEPELVHEYNPGSFIMEFRVVNDNLFFVTLETGLNVLNISNPESPVLVGYYRTEGEFCSLDIHGNKAFIAGYDTGIHILDISHFTHPMNSLVLNRGFNLVSFPYTDVLASEIITHITPVAYSYNTILDAYEEPGTIFNTGIGYWVLASSDTIFDLSDREPVDEVTLNIYPGWNLIGTPNVVLASELIESIPEITSSLLSFNTHTRAYEEPHLLEPLKGYWLFSTDSLEITLP